MRARFFFAVVVALLLVAPTSALAATWDLAIDFAATGDSSGPWAKDIGGNTVWYFKLAPTGSPTNPTVYSNSALAWTTTYSWMPPGTPGLKGWARSPGGLPHVSVNTGADAISTTTPPFTWRSGKVLSHPMPAGDAWPYSVIEWKSPVAGNAGGSITLTDVDGGGGDGFQYWILKNSAQLDTGTVPNGGTVTETLTDEVVSSGDSIYVVLGPGVAGLHSYDSTQIDMSITVPDPPVVSTPASSGWTIAVLGMLGVAIAARKTRAFQRS
jgi:hypothetical protein